MASVERGMWFARSAVFMEADHMEFLRWMRVFGDMLFAAGLVALRGRFGEPAQRHDRGK